MVISESKIQSICDLESSNTADSSVPSVSCAKNEFVKEHKVSRNIYLERRACDKFGQQCGFEFCVRTDFKYMPCNKIPVDSFDRNGFDIVIIFVFGFDKIRNR